MKINLIAESKKDAEWLMDALMGKCREIEITPLPPYAAKEDDPRRQVILTLK